MTTTTRRGHMDHGRETTPQQDEYVIATPNDLRQALVRRFLANADAGDNVANTALVNEINDWQRSQQEPDS